jgi:hypothetical protein
MALAAAQVIDALAARISGATSAGTRVFTSRAWPIGEDDLPAWRVTAASESIAGVALGDYIHEHHLEVEARAYVRAVANLDDAMHALAEAALPALFAPPVPYALEHAGIDRELTAEGEAAVGVITLRLRASYFTRPTAPQTILSS